MPRPEWWDSPWVQRPDRTAETEKAARELNMAAHVNSAAGAAPYESLTPD